MKYQLPSIVVVTALLAACDAGTTTNPSIVPDSTTLNASCVTAVAEQANVSANEVNAISTVSTDTGTLTTVSLQDAVAPWNCRADSSGTITSIEYNQEG
jgi:hypothetical protein